MSVHLFVYQMGETVKSSAS